MKNTIAKAKTGKYEGFVDDNGIVNFLGIHYVKTPERWKRAGELGESEEHIMAKEFGDICPQPLYPEEHDKTVPMSEDCLTLNIWTDDIDKKNKPVMLWIHGGCYLSGSNRISYYCNDKAAADCRDIVFVNINYRLGNFGSMDLSNLDKTGEYKDAPNLQTYDQMAAIKWVYENIEAFGGDPENITVYGQSAGSYSTATLLLIPEANQYINKAICQSSGFEKTQKTIEDSRLMGKAFADYAGINTLEEALNLSTEEVLEASLKIFEDARFPRAFGAIRDGELIPQEPYKALKSGVANGISLMAGTVSGEYDTEAYEMSDEEIKDKILKLFGDRVSEDMIEAYVSNYPERGRREAYMDLRNDMAIRMPVLTILEQQSLSGADTYMYYIDYTPEGSNLRAQHMFEIPFLNDKTQIPVYMEMSTDEPVQGKHPDKKLIKELQGCWTCFARTGNPGGVHIGLRWPKYECKSKKTMVLDNKGWRVEKNFREKDTKLLQHLMYE